MGGSSYRKYWLYSWLNSANLPAGKFWLTRKNGGGGGSASGGFARRLPLIRLPSDSSLELLRSGEVTGDEYAEEFLDDELDELELNEDELKSPKYW